MSHQPLATLLPKKGEVVAGRFRVDDTLGVGGMGGVLAVLDMQRGARVALKLMLPHLLANEELVGRFAREASAASVLRTPHVAKVFEVGHTPEGAPFMVMELLEGKDLDQTLRARGPFPIPEAVGYVLEACHAVAEAHARGIIHRDLKPSNLFLANIGGRSVLKVLDFGISKTTVLGGGGSANEGLTATDTTLGSPQYMSPEQIRSSKRVDTRTDLWSLGIILHKLLTGRLAFHADSVGAHLIMIVTDPPAALRDARPDAPVELERVVLRCLQKDLSLRFQNVGQLALALLPFADAGRQPLVDSIVEMVGKEAALAPPPALADVEPDAATVVRTDSSRGAATLSDAPIVHAPDTGTTPGWTGSTTPPRRGLYVGAVLGALGVLGAVLAVQLAAAPDAAPSAPSALAAQATDTKPPPSATPAAAADNAPPAASDASVTLEIEPAEAEVEIDGVPVPGRPLRLPRRPGSYRVTVRAPGYLPETRELGLQSDAVVRVVLRKAAPSAPAGGAERPRKGRVLLETNL